MGWKPYDEGDCFCERVPNEENGEWCGAVAKWVRTNLGSAPQPDEEDPDDAAYLCDEHYKTRNVCSAEAAPHHRNCNKRKGGKDCTC